MRIVSRKTFFNQSYKTCSNTRAGKMNNNLFKYNFFQKNTVSKTRVFFWCSNTLYFQIKNYFNTNEVVGMPVYHITLKHPTANFDLTTLAIFSHKQHVFRSLSIASVSYTHLTLPTIYSV